MKLISVSVEKKSKREEWIDFAKGIGIILVVWAHALPRECSIWVFINQFHMPFFFMISGYLYKKCISWQDFLLRKIKSLWIPYVCCSLLTCIVGSIINYPSVLEMSKWLKTLLKIILMIEPGPLLGATWFIQVLFWAIIMYDVIFRLCNLFFPKQYEEIIAIISIACLLIGIITCIPFHGSVILNSFAFISIGHLCKRLSLFDKLNMYGGILLVIVCWIISLYNKVSYVSNTFSSPGFFVTSAICGSIGLLCICKRIANYNTLTRVFSSIGKESMGPMIWQFVSFKLVIIIQIIFYKLKWNAIESFPVIYDYAFGIWVILDILMGILFSILIYHIVNTPIQKCVNKFLQSHLKNGLI